VPFMVARLYTRQRTVSIIETTHTEETQILKALQLAANPLASLIIPAGADESVVYNACLALATQRSNRVSSAVNDSVWSSLVLDCVGNEVDVAAHLIMCQWYEAVKTQRANCGSVLAPTRLNTPLNQQ